MLEENDWEKEVVSGGKYYFKRFVCQLILDWHAYLYTWFNRNQTSLVAFTIPPGWGQGSGLSIVATHVDSPNLRIRPVSKRSKAGYLQVGVETYVPLSYPQYPHLIE